MGTGNDILDLILGFVHDNQGFDEFGIGTHKRTGRILQVW